MGSYHFGNSRFSFEHKFLRTVIFLELNTLLMFFDLHTHPSLKSLLTNGKINCWGLVDAIGKDFDSQCNLNQMKNGHVKIAVASLHPLERPFCEPFLLKTILPYFSPLDGDFLKRIQKNKISYY